MDDLISVKTENGLMLIAFVRPKLRNLLSLDVLDALEHTFKRSERLSGIEKIVVTGSEGVFASGADLREIGGLDANEVKQFALKGQKLMAYISEMQIPVMAAVNGFCYGGALDLALACRRRAASTNASFCHPGAGLGIITGWGGTQRLPRLVGEANALEMFFTASPIPAHQALRIGLIDEINDDPVGTLINSLPRPPSPRPPA